MAKKALGNLDDALSALPITDFSGGLNTYTSGLSLKSNESPEMLNVIPFIGRLLYRGGYLEYSPTTAAADQEYAFYDSLGNKHLVVWRNGGLVDTITGAESAVENAVYNAGQRVGVVDLNGILYWSTQTTHLRFWNPVAGTTGAVAQTGVSPPPASPLLMLYTNAIVAFGVDYTGTYQATVMGWSAVNAPTNWDAANSQAVGPRTIAVLEFGLVMGIAEVGVAPFRTFVVGRSDKGLIAYTGALGSLSETLISCPVGCADGASAQFAPSAEKFGTIIFLGTDGQFYSTNGVTCDPISVVHDASGIRGIQPTLSAAFADALVTAGNRFWSGYNEAYQYYFCTVAGQQFVYKWDLKCWTLFQGWPVGPCVNFTDLTGLPQMYIAANTPLVVNDVATFMVAEVALPNLDDNGTVPRVYYKTPWLHMDNPKKFKEYHWISPQFYAKGAIYKVTGQSLPRAIDNSSMVTKPLLFTTPVGVNPYEFELDVSELDDSDLLGGPGDGALVGTGNPVVSFGRLVCDYVPSGMLAGLTGMKEILKGSAAQFTVELYPDSLVCDFELLGLEILWLDRGYMRDAGNKYNPESGVPYGFPGYPAAFDPMMPPELQLNAIGGTKPNAYANLRSKQGGAAFKPLPSGIKFAGFAVHDFEGESTVLSADNKYLYVACEDITFAQSYILKVSTNTGAIVAQSVNLDNNDEIYAIILSPDNTRVYALANNPSRIITLSTTDMSVLNTAALHAGVNNGRGIAVSDDGTTVSAVLSNVAACYILNTTTFAVTSFAITAGFKGGGVCFPKGDSSHVLVADCGTSGNILKYTTAGALTTTYVTGVAGTPANGQFTLLRTHPTSGIVFGVNAFTPSMFAYDIGAVALLAQSATTAVVGAMAPDGTTAPSAMYGKADQSFPDVYRLNTAGTFSTQTFPSDGLNDQDFGGIGVDSTNGILYTQCADTSDLTTLRLEAIAK